MQKERKELVASCPCCGQMRGEQDCRELLTTGVEYYSRDAQGEIIERVWRVKFKNTFETWACDECLRSGRAIKANVNIQNFVNYYPIHACYPHFAYFDRTGSCRDCSKDFLFAKEEQRHWYEKLGLMVHARQVRCHGCRAAKKLKDRFNMLLSTADYSNSARVEETVELGIRQQQYPQVKHFLTVGQRKFKKKSTTYQWLEKLWLTVEKAESVSAANVSCAITAPGRSAVPDTGNEAPDTTL